MCVICVFPASVVLECGGKMNQNEKPPAGMVCEAGANWKAPLVEVGAREGSSSSSCQNRE